MRPSTCTKVLKQGARVADRAAAQQGGGNAAGALLCKYLRQLLPCCLLLLNACAVTLNNAPRNAPLDHPQAAHLRAPTDQVGENVVALAFSGGGIRAAAYSYGVLQGLEGLPSSASRTLFDELTFISSVSGGSLTAAYFGLYGRAGLATFRERVLLSDGEARMRFSLLNPVNLARLLAGGLNDRDSLHDWLEKEVFAGATYADLFRHGKPEVWINATSLYDRMPFPFNQQAFDFLCSDLSKLPVSEAVSASMAVPLVFAPVILETHPQRCQHPMPPWLDKALTDPQTPMTQRAMARILRSLRDADRPHYLKLVDGGITDNFGLATIAQSRMIQGTPYGPISTKDAINIRNMLFLVVDAGQGPTARPWHLEIAGPGGIDIATAAIDTAMEANVRLSFDAFLNMMQQWREDVVRYRCGLSQQEQAAIVARKPGWRCDDVQFRVSRVAFDSLDEARARSLQAIPTRLKLPMAQVDQLIAAGRDSVKVNPVVMQFVKQLNAQP